MVCVHVSSLSVFHIIEARDALSGTLHYKRITSDGSPISRICCTLLNTPFSEDGTNASHMCNLAILLRAKVAIE